MSGADVIIFLFNSWRNQDIEKLPTYWALKSDEIGRVQGGMAIDWTLKSEGMS
jgi:hypothetical protein